MSQSLNVGNLVNQISQSATSGMENVAQLSNTMDVSSPGDMAKMQMAMMKVNMAFQLEASITKSVEDMLKAIVQRM